MLASDFKCSLVKLFIYPSFEAKQTIKHIYELFLVETTVSIDISFLRKRSILQLGG